VGRATNIASEPTPLADPRIIPRYLGSSRYRNTAAFAVLIALAAPAGAQANPQQQKMTECNAQAKGMTGDARKSFMGSCLSGPAETKGLHCTKGKPCGNSCIAQDKVCHK
jgi:hypothetical protein